MRVAVTTEHRFDRTPDGAVWTQTMFPHGFWARYLEAFDEVRVVARARAVDRPPPGGTRADGDGVTFAVIPHYLGPRQFLAQQPRIRAAARAAVGPRDAAILRVVSPIGSLVEKALRRTRQPYGVEVVGDPYDVFVAGAVKHPLRRFFRWYFPRQLRRQCAGACAAAYVTESALQRRYPPAPGVFSTHYSSVELPESVFVPAPRSGAPAGGPLRLLTIGSLSCLYKGTDVLIDALAECRRAELDLTLTIVGDGNHRAELEARAHAAGLGGRVRFLGQIPSGAPVREQLDGADLFVMPSRTEGLPRAMVEAMARALPCIGSDVGGIPELLRADDLVPAGDSAALARKIQDVVANPPRQAEMSARNLARAHDYRLDVLRERWVAFHREVRERTEEWQKTRGAARVSSFPSPEVEARSGLPVGG